MLIPDRAGVMILGGACLFPQALLPLFIFEPRYRTMLSDALESQRVFCIAMQKPGQSRETPMPIAGLGLIRASVQNANGTSNLILQGIVRVRLGRALRYKPYRVHSISPLPSENQESLAIDALRGRVIDLVDLRLRQGSAVAPTVLCHLAAGTPDNPPSVEACLRTLQEMQDPGQMADLVALLLLRHPHSKQVILQSISVEERLRYLVQFLLADVAEKQAGGGGE
jgi:Lon protease-like protein